MLIFFSNTQYKQNMDKCVNIKDLQKKFTNIRKQTFKQYSI